MDSVELEYERAIANASRQGDNDTAYDLSIGLQQYRRDYKVKE